MKYILLLILFYSNLYAQLFESYTADNSGLPSNQVTSITIVEGAIWATTDKGIAVFDGSTWQAYSTSNGLSSNKVSSSILLLGSSKDELLIGTDTGTTDFTIDNQSIIFPINYLNASNSNIVSNNILSLASWHDKNKWIGTDNGISLVTTDSTLNMQVGDVGIRMKSNYINSLAVSSDTVLHKANPNYTPASGVIYAATNGGGVSRFYMHEVDGITSASIVQKQWSGLPSDTVLTIFVDDKNNHWYGTPKGVASHYAHNSKNADWSLYNTSDGLINNRVTSIATDNYGHTWFGTIGGISRFDGSSWISFTEADGLISNNVSDIKVDAENTIWIATDKGISKLQNPTAVEYSKPLLTKMEINLEAFPNPFNLQVNFKVSLSEGSTMNLQIFSFIGELVNEIKKSNYPKGVFNYSWNGKDANDKVVNSGIYFVRLTSGKQMVTKKIILIK